MKRNLILLSIAAVALAACQKEEMSEQTVSGNSIYATIEQPADETKTSLDGTSVQWVAADEIKLWDSDGSTGIYKTTTPGADVQFTAVSSTATVDVDKQLYGFYPAGSFSEKEDSDIEFSISDEQGYVANSFGDGSNYAVANKPALGTGDNKLHFKNVAGVLKIQLSVADGDAATVGKIVLSSNAGEPAASKYICGTFTVDASADSPVATYTSDGDTVITLNCGTAGVALSDDSSNPTTFHFVVPAGSFTKGFTAKVYSLQDHLITTLSSTKSQTIARSVVRLMKNKEVNWLPASGYTECKYISVGSTAGPVINSGVVPYYGMDISMKYGWYPSLEYTGEGKGSSFTLFGAEEYPTTLIDFCVYRQLYNSGSTIYCSYSPRILGTSNSTIKTPAGVSNNLYIEDGNNIHSFKFQFRETTSYLSSPTALPSGLYWVITNSTERPPLPTSPLGIIGRCFNTKYSGEGTNMNIYDVTIDNQSGTGTSAERERHFIPVYTSSSEYGMYDIVTSSFFGNVGTGSFSGSI